MRVLNKRDRGTITTEAVYVGRPTKWGNPFPTNDPLLPPGLNKTAKHQMVVDEYRRWIQTQPDLLAALDELRGKDLICWCSPLPCHADVLLELANSPWPSTVEVITLPDPCLARQQQKSSFDAEVTMGIICPYGIEHQDEEIKSVASFAKNADEDIDKAIFFMCPCNKSWTLKKALRTATFNQVEARVIRKEARLIIEKCRAEEILERPAANRD